MPRRSVHWPSYSSEHEPHTPLDQLLHLAWKAYVVVCPHPRAAVTLHRPSRMIALGLGASRNGCLQPARRGCWGQRFWWRASSLPSTSREAPWTGHCTSSWCCWCLLPRWCALLRSGEHQCIIIHMRLLCPSAAKLSDILDNLPEPKNAAELLLSSLHSPSTSAACARGMEREGNGLLQREGADWTEPLHGAGHHLEVLGEACCPQCGLC